VNPRVGRGLLVLGAALLSAWYWGGQPGQGAPEYVESAGRADDAPLRAAEARRARGLGLQISGVVDRTLADDRDGSPHQRFIIRTSSGLTLLVAHNLDLAPRLEGLAPGESVVVKGDYEWNERGGVMHWTHDDPAGNHPAGYIEWKGRRYQ
jgi:hypothetical protein